jgi:hypothetical protein
MSRLLAASTAGSAMPSLDGLRVLPWATCGADVVPGRPGRVRQLADELDAIARGLGLMKDLVARRAPSGWRGPAATAYELVLDQQPARYTAAVQAMSSAASALRSHAAVLEVSQERADEAVRRDAVAATATRQWLATASPGEQRVAGSATDPGAVPRHVADVAAADARRLVAASAASTADCLRRAARGAPDRPSTAVRSARAVLGLGREVRQGLVESLAGDLALAVRLDPGRLMWDPSGYWSDAGRLGAGLGHAVRHPTQLVAAVADVQTLRESPGRWVGHLLPDLALAVGTAGALPAAERTASVAARLASRVGPSELRAPLRRAVSAQRGTGRGPILLRDVRPYLGPPDALGHRAELGPVDHAVAQRVVRDSRWAEQHVTPRLAVVAQEVGRRLGGSGEVRLNGLDHVLKDGDSLKRKLALEVSPEHGAGALAPRVNDTIRYTLTVPHDAYVAGAVQVTDRMADHGFRLAGVKSFWESDRYRGLNLTVHDAPTGRPFELQVHTPDSWDATVDTHPDYAVYRSPAAWPELQETYRQRIAARFSLVPVPDGVSEMPGLLPVPHGAALMTVPQLRTLTNVPLGVALSASGGVGRSLACDDDR